jgi:LPXTG-site transpeptidase (sortase) family protein
LYYKSLYNVSTMASNDDIPQFQLPRKHGKVIQPLSSSLQLHNIPATPIQQSAHTPEPHAQILPPATTPTVIAPNVTMSTSTQADDSPAIDLIRQKLNDLYSKEPDAKEEKREVANLPVRSKHQQYMYDLSHSGKSLAEIQIAWHSYYANLPDADKHEVWHEFYANHGQEAAPEKPEPEPAPVHTARLHATHHAAEAKEPAAETKEMEGPKHKLAPAKKHRKSTTRHADPRTAAEVKEQLLGTVKTRSRRKSNSHVQSLLFGLSTGLVMIVILLFGFFNERFIAPFMTPSRAVSSTPIIIDPTSAAVGSEPIIIIPKINVEIPVVYDEPSIKEEKIQAALERGVVHYATTPNPGEKGNSVIFGHSANNILNSGKYKFAFVLLKRLELGDTFYVQKDGKRYVYKVFDKKIVPPTDLSVLKPTDKPATMTLITCDPPGTNINRLVVVGEQVSPDPTTNVASTAKAADNASSSADLPGDAPTLWSRIKSFFE